MSLSLVETAIVTRLRADATLVALLYGGDSSYISTNLGPPASNYPYVVLETTDKDDGMSSNTDATQFRALLHVYAQTNQGQVAARGIIARIRGEASRTPSYGLHRHALNLNDSEWVAQSPMIQVASETQHDRDTLHYLIEYTGRTSRPVTGS